MAHRPHHSPKSSDFEKVYEKSPTRSISFTKRIHKLQLNSKGVEIREIPDPISPTSKKRRAHDMVKKIQKK